MRIIRVKDYQKMSVAAASVIAAQVILKPDSVLGLATGGTPVGVYQQLINSYQNGTLDFSRVRTVNLDEYVGLNAQDESSYAFFMRQKLFNAVNIEPSNTHIPDGRAADIDEECARYDTVLRNLGGIDLQLLGLGMNGHIGFNEPADAFTGHTHRVELTGSTREANKRFFPEGAQIPAAAVTMGIMDIVQARKILIIASGASKAKALAEAFWGPVTPRVPASILQFHPDVTLVADEEALALSVGYEESGPIIDFSQQ
ncbi:MAG: glucosamine-6-phosphate deaminase [Oscillospiraceae bacterium]|nr:glucosamine-6-phosphate deaminase [Oscillospiraceae bacterium]